MSTMRDVSEALRAEPLPPAFSDDALALLFSAEHADTLRYVALWNRWYRWTGKLWEQDTTLLAFDLVRDLCRRIAAKANEGGRVLASHRTVAAVASLARAAGAMLQLLNSGTATRGCLIRRGARSTYARD
jgi:phage/plasmid-associated DNA primase